MSSGLSGSCQTAKMLADDYDGKVQVVNNQRISVTQLYSVEDAKAFAEAGMNATRQICKKLEEEALESSIYVTVTTLKYLKKRRTYHTGSSGSWNHAASEAGTADPW